MYWRAKDLPELAELRKEDRNAFFRAVFLRSYSGMIMFFVYVALMVSFSLLSDSLKRGSEVHIFIAFVMFGVFAGVYTAIFNTLMRKELAIELMKIKEQNVPINIGIKNIHLSLPITSKILGSKYFYASLVLLIIVTMIVFMHTIEK